MKHSGAFLKIYIFVFNHTLFGIFLGVHICNISIFILRVWRIVRVLLWIRNRWNLVIIKILLFFGLLQLI